MHQGRILQGRDEPRSQLQLPNIIWHNVRGALHRRSTKRYTKPREVSGMHFGLIECKLAALYVSPRCSQHAKTAVEKLPFANEGPSDRRSDLVNC